MAPWLILVVMVVYGVISFDFFRTGNVGMAIVFAGYSASNIGLWMASK